MTTLRSFRAMDLYNFNHINLDALTETYSTSFYMVSVRDKDELSLCGLILSAFLLSLLLCLSAIPLHVAQSLCCL